MKIITMELVYSVDYRSLPKSSDFLLEDKTVCSLSCKNILAFSRQSSGNKDGYVLWWLGGRVVVVLFRLHRVRSNDTQTSDGDVGLDVFGCRAEILGTKRRPVQDYGFVSVTILQYPRRRSEIPWYFRRRCGNVGNISLTRII